MPERTQQRLRPVRMRQTSATKRGDEWSHPELGDHGPLEALLRRALLRHLVLDEGVDGDLGRAREAGVQGGAQFVPVLDVR